MACSVAANEHPRAFPQVKADSLLPQGEVAQEPKRDPRLRAGNRHFLLDIFLRESEPSAIQNAWARGTLGGEEKERETFGTNLEAIFFI
jgi:hypothetical protein